VAQTAALHGGTVVARGAAWDASVDGAIHYRDAHGTLTLPLPMLAGAHQAENAALAVAMLRHQSAVTISTEAMAQGIRATRWPARLQRLGAGPLTARVPGRTVWLDGGHNPDAGLAIARHLSAQPPVHVIIGMLANKDPAAILGPLGDHALSISVVPAPGHDAHRPEDFAAHSALPVRSFADVDAALAAARHGRRADRRLALSGRGRPAPERRSAGLTARKAQATRRAIRDHRPAGLYGASAMGVMRMAQRGFAVARFRNIFGRLFDPGVKAGVFAHFGMELQRQQIAPAPEGLVRIDMAGGKQFGLGGRVKVSPCQCSTGTPATWRKGLSATWTCTG
jgi:hypothetical protein